MGIPRKKKTLCKDILEFISKLTVSFIPLGFFFSCTSHLKLDVGTVLLTEGVLFKLNCPSTLSSGEELLLLKSAEGLSEALGLYLASFVPHSLFT